MTPNINFYDNQPDLRSQGWVQLRKYGDVFVQSFYTTNILIWVG